MQMTVGTRIVGRNTVKDHSTIMRNPPFQVQVYVSILNNIDSSFYYFSQVASLHHHLFS